MPVYQIQKYFNMKNSIDHFKRLAEIYVTQDPNSKDHVTKMMLAKGVVIQMESDLIIFEKSKGETEKSKEQKDRIKILRAAISTFSDVSINNLQIGYILYTYQKENELQSLKIDRLENEINKLKQQLEF